MKLLVLRRIGAVVLVWIALINFSNWKAALGGDYSCLPGGAPAAVRCGSAAFDVANFVFYTALIGVALWLAVSAWRGRLVGR